MWLDHLSGFRSASLGSVREVLYRSADYHTPFTKGAEDPSRAPPAMVKDG